MKNNYKELRILIKGGGDLGSGIAWKLKTCGFNVAVLDLPHPLCIRRNVCFAEAINSCDITIEGIKAVHVKSYEQISDKADIIPVFTIEQSEILDSWAADVIIDATLKNISKKQTIKSDAPFTIGLGPGFTAPEDIDCIIETQRGHNLGRVIWSGKAEDFTGVPGDIKGYSSERIIRAPAAGKFTALKKISDKVTKGDIIGWINRTEITASIDGVIRGLIRDGIQVPEDFKLGDIDPRSDRESVYTISDKARNIAGAALEAILCWIDRQ